MVFLYFISKGCENMEKSLEQLKQKYEKTTVLLEQEKRKRQRLKNRQAYLESISNYYTPKDFDRLVNVTTIALALLQNETHPYYQSSKMKKHVKQYGTVMEPWFPLGGRGNAQRLFNDKTITKITKAHNKTSA